VYLVAESIKDMAVLSYEFSWFAIHKTGNKTPKYSIALFKYIGRWFAKYFLLRKLKINGFLF
jgi:hypothetical protein